MKFMKEWEWDKTIVIESLQKIATVLGVIFLCVMATIGFFIFSMMANGCKQQPGIPMIPGQPTLTTMTIEEVERTKWFEIVGPKEAYVGETIRLHALLHESIPGDANCDGRVNLMDYMILEIFWLRTGKPTWRHGDFNLDGVVDLKDYMILERHYGLEIPFEGVVIALAEFGRNVKYEDVSKHMIMKQQF